MYKQVCSALYHVVDSKCLGPFSRFSNLWETVMIRTEAVNIPVTLSGEGTASSLVPALCWRHHRLFDRVQAA